jgi:hypothetical protein
MSNATEEEKRVTLRRQVEYTDGLVLPRGSMGSVVMEGCWGGTLVRWDGQGEARTVLPSQLEIAEPRPKLRRQKR